VTKMASEVALYNTECLLTACCASRGEVRSKRSTEDVVVVLLQCAGFQLCCKLTHSVLLTRRDQDERISTHIFRHSFAVRYLVLGHEDMTTVKNYMHMNDETIQVQRRK
jgi:site-specific recombinase XerD